MSKRVFAVTADVNNYLILQETELEMSVQLTTGDLYILDGTPKIKDWEAVHVDWLIVPGETGLTVPDIAAWGATIFAIPEKVSRILEPSLKDSCELLPLTLDGEAWHVVHILSCLEALDEERSTRNMRNGKPSRTRRFNKLVLNSDAITTRGLFRVKGVGLTTYCADVEGGFYELVKQNNLKGLKFREVELS
ncbi:imm11 family protein [Litoribacillus peritrichatus]|uniref:Immunity MXAN-0049 protein domain-containing protein n=1 Tax=Litoribacillus peritrichatus TaxID=718191 RepID=A0ABP7MLH6_9GAMM